MDIDFTAETKMGFGQYDFVPDGVIDTDTVLDDSDKGNIDPNAPLDPSGESEGGDEDYFQVCFTYPTGSGVAINYFTYQYGSGAYPDLDGITSTPVADFGKGFPRMYFRLDGVRMDDDTQASTKAYTDSIRLGNKLDTPWLEVSDQIYNSLSSVSKIRDVCLIECVPANTTIGIEQEYLHNYFRILYNLRSAITYKPSQPVDEFTTWAAHEGCVIQSKDGATTIGNSASAFGYQQITGVFGPMGTTQSGRGTGTRQVLTTTSNNDGEVIETYEPTIVNYHYYRFQESVTYYTEVRVYELTGTAQVGGRTVSKSGDDENLMVPLDYAFRKMFSAHERETLYARASRVLICTEYTVKSKWYQTGIFQAVMVTIAVVLTWWTGGASLTLVGAVTAAASAIGAMVVMSLLGKYVFSKLGGVFAIIAAVVALAVAIYTGYLYLTSTTGPFSVTATQMMQVSNVAFKASQYAQQGAIAKELQKIATLEEEIADKQAALDAAQKELNNPYNTIEDGVLLKAIDGYVYLGESPNEYFARSLNTNIGVETNNLVDMYYSQSLETPSDVAINQLILQNIQRPFELFNELNNQINQ
jgi:cell division protein FtsL